MAGSIQKPLLRSPVKAYIIKSFMFSALVSCVFGWSYKHFVAHVRKQRYADFYKDYNAEAEANRLYKMGLIRSYSDNDDKPDEPFIYPYQQMVNK